MVFEMFGKVFFLDVLRGAFPRVPVDVLLEITLRVDKTSEPAGSVSIPDNP